LWGDTDGPLSLSDVVEEASTHNQYIYTHVISLRREDAARFGYESAGVWRSLVKSKIPIIAQAMNIPITDLKWYGAFHDMEHHPHVHLMMYSIGPKKGYLKNAGIEKMRSAFATEIFKQDLLQVYEQKNGVRLELNKSAGEHVQSLVERIQVKDYDNPTVTAMITRLADELKHIKGRKVYGNLKGADKQAARNLVDAIVGELSKDPDIAEIYNHWCGVQDDIKRLYMNNPPPHPSLVDENEFTTIKNMIIRKANELNIVKPDGVLTSTQPDGRPSESFTEQIFEPTEESASTEASAAPAPTGASFYAEWTDDYKKAKKYLYGKGVEQNYNAAFTLFCSEAENGNALAMYDAGKMLLDGVHTDADIDKARDWFMKAYNAFISLEAESHNNYLQYRIGKLYSLDHGVDKDYVKSAEWFQKSADQGDQFAQYSLGSQYYYGSGVEQSYETAFKLFSDANSQGNPFAAYELGRMYKSGIGTNIDVDKSKTCFKTAYSGLADLEKKNGGEQLQHRLGQMCLAGEGTDINIPAAVEYLTKASTLGNIHSMHALLKLHRDDVPDIDIVTVIQKLTKEAENENDFAQFSLGSFYVFDKNERDIEKAMFWLKKSAGYGNAYAEKTIEYLSNPANQTSPVSAAVSLLRNLSRIIADDYQKTRQNYESRIDRKLLRKIIQKKEAQGMRQTLE